MEYINRVQIWRLPIRLPVVASNPRCSPYHTRVDKLFFGISITLLRATMASHTKGTVSLCGRRLAQSKSEPCYQYCLAIFQATNRMVRPGVKTGVCFDHPCWIPVLRDVNHSLQIWLYLFSTFIVRAVEGNRNRINTHQNIVTGLSGLII